jgi:hypothetical protein
MEITCKACGRKVLLLASASPRVEQPIMDEAHKCGYHFYCWKPIDPFIKLFIIHKYNREKLNENKDKGNK